MKLFLLISILLLLVTGCDNNETAVLTDTNIVEGETEENDELLKNEKESKNIEIEKDVNRPVLPARYSYREEHRLPKIRNQEGTNLCWAYASLAAIECSKDEDAGISFSVDHLLQFNPFEDTFSEGGSYVVPMAYSLAWYGPVIDAEETVESESYETKKAVLHVQEVRQSEPRDFEAIKRFVYLYGGVESALYLDFDDLLQESSCYNKETNSYCYLGEAVSNHDVVIVGWDDTYPKQNFHEDVATDGAFICQNSWGESFGDNGIFYVSYEDVNIGGYGIVYSRIDQADNYDNIYQSDLCGFTAQIGYGQEECCFANVYTANDNELVRAAGFYATGKNTTYEIYFVNKFENRLSFSKKKLLCSGFLEDAGFYTIDFPQGVEVDAGEEFAVVIKIKTENAEYPVAIECPVENLSEHANISDGRGFLSHQGFVWEHIEETKNYNICLKVYTDLRRE